MLGRNSLYVFCIGSLLSLTGQIVRFDYRGTVGIDTVVVILRHHHHGIHRMARRIATTHPAGAARAVRAAIIAALIVAAPALACAQNAASPAPQSPLSKACQPGAGALAGDPPLPNVAAALAQRKVLRILAMGAAPGRIGAGRRLHRADRGHAGERAQGHRRHHDQSRRLRRTRRQRRNPHEERGRARGARPGALAGRHQ